MVCCFAVCCYLATPTTPVFCGQAGMANGTPGEQSNFFRQLDCELTFPGKSHSGYNP